MKKYSIKLSWRKRIGPKLILPLCSLHRMFIWKESDQPRGISCIIRVKNEEDWIEMSLKSVVPFADELIVVDSGSTDKSYDIVNKMAKILPISIKVFQRPDLYYCDLSNFALSKTSYSWVMKWDADFVGCSDIDELRKNVLSFTKGDYLFYPNLINLDGDLEHTMPGEELITEGYIHYYRRHIKFHMRGPFEQLLIPLHYRRIFINKPYIFHLRSIKPARNVLFRSYFAHWNGLGDYETFPKLEDYVYKQIQIEYNTKSIEEAMRAHQQKECKKLIRYQPKKYRDYPEILKRAIKMRKYQVIYRDGFPIGRNDVL